jgi:hypothetical protein
VPLCLVILLQQTLRNDFNLGVFSAFHGKVFLRVDFRLGFGDRSSSQR